MPKIRYKILEEIFLRLIILYHIIKNNNFRSIIND